MQIFFKTLSGKTLDIDYETQDTANVIKDKIQAKYQIEPSTQTVVVAGKKWKDDETYAQFAQNNHAEKKIEYNATLHLLVTPLHYLMIDHGGVLDGEFVENTASLSDGDLLITEFDQGGAQVLKNGVQVVQIINELVRDHDYRVVFHSKNTPSDQLLLVEQLSKACRSKGIPFPAVHALASYDARKMPDILSTDPSIDTIEGIKTASWGADDENGKSSLRRALETLLHISPGDRPRHIVFDDGAPVIEAAKAEGYQTYLIGNEPGSFSLNQAMQAVLSTAKSNKLAQRHRAANPTTSSETQSSAIRIFNAQLKLFKTAYETLDANLTPQQRADAASLHRDLTKASKEYFDGTLNEIRYQVFQIHCRRHLKSARSSLTECGLGQIVANILLAVAGLGVFYFLAAGINRVKNGHWMFFNSNIADAFYDVQHATHKLKPS